VFLLRKTHLKNGTFVINKLLFSLQRKVTSIQLITNMLFPNGGNYMENFKIFLRTTTNMTSPINNFLKLTVPRATSSIPTKEQNYIKSFFPLDPAISKEKSWGKVEETKNKDHGLANRN
jgi:hypothetical protein